MSAMPWMLLAGAAAALLARWLLLRAFQSARITGSPTPAEARVVEETKQQARDLVNENEKEQEDLSNATADDLVRRKRDRLR